MRHNAARTAKRLPRDIAVGDYVIIKYVGEKPTTARVDAIQKTRGSDNSVRYVATLTSAHGTGRESYAPGRKVEVVTAWLPGTEPKEV